MVEKIVSGGYDFLFDGLVLRWNACGWRVFDSESVGDLSTRPSALLKMTHCGWFWFPCLGGEPESVGDFSASLAAPVEMTNIHA